jgi:NAD(P)-dependent dehydrogenase (short-subunit alcohol dehydrogenase family)
MDGAQEAVLVTGGASGIGLAVARGLLGAGRRVLVADVSQERLDEVRGLAPADRLGCVRMDVSDEAQVSEAIARLESDFGRRVSAATCRSWRRTRRCCGGSWK